MIDYYGYIIDKLTKEHQNMKYDCVIIGAGMSGLAAGIRLAHFGKKVCIFESHTRIGGLNSFFSRKGFGLETGLHAMTNFAPKVGAKALPLSKLLRQLRIPYDSLLLREQNYSQIVFPSKTLRFTNNFSEFEASVAEAFPSQIDGFLKFNEYVKSYNEVSLTDSYISAKQVMAEYFNDKLLRDMLLCPLMYYGSAVEDDMDFSQFVIMYKSIFFEGFCRPAGKGVLQILDRLMERYEESGGELRLGCGITSIVTKDGKAVELITNKGESILADKILSSAGNIETLSLCDEPPATIQTLPKGELGYIETLAIEGDYLDLFNNDQTITFFSNKDSFEYKKPESAYSTDSGVICFPHNFKFLPDDTPVDKTIRVTALANHSYWFDKPKDEYIKLKQEATSKIFKVAEKLTGIIDIEKNAQLIDTMTPKTISRYTGHIHGSIYGSPHKVKDGTTHLDNLFICGTDQGFLGITGAMLSGISMANLHMLR